MITFHYIIIIIIINIFNLFLLLLILPFQLIVNAKLLSIDPTQPWRFAVC